MHHRTIGAAYASDNLREYLGILKLPNRDQREYLGFLSIL